MQDGNFLLSALQPEAGVCSLALPSDLQLDRRGAPGPEAERLRAARVQEQVRARLLQLGQQQRHNGTAEPATVAAAARGRRLPGGGRAPGGGEGGAVVAASAGAMALARPGPEARLPDSQARSESPGPPCRAWGRPQVGPPAAPRGPRGLWAEPAWAPRVPSAQRPRGGRRDAHTDSPPGHGLTHGPGTRRHARRPE